MLELIEELEVVQSVKYRIWNKIDKKGEDECWPWTGKANDGYGRIYIDGNTIKAHRAVYLLTYGAIPKNKPSITHTCNNRLCCNPKHLKADTNEGNTQYMVACDRQAKGENNGNSILTIDDVRRIRDLHNNLGYSYERLADMFNISIPTISLIIRNKTWKDKDYIYKRKKSSLLTIEQEIEVRERFSKGNVTQDQLAKEYGVSRPLIWSIIRVKGKKGE